MLAGDAGPAVAVAMRLVLAMAEVSRAERLVEVTSAHGSVRCRARVGDVVQRGQVFLPMHNAATNVLTHPVVDPISRQPSYKDTPVAVRRVRPRR